MSSVVISGDTSGAITLAAPSVAGTNTISLPANTGTMALVGNIASASTAYTLKQIGSVAGSGTPLTYSDWSGGSMTLPAGTYFFSFCGTIENQTTTGSSIPVQGLVFCLVLTDSANNFIYGASGNYTNNEMTYNIQCLSSSFIYTVPTATAYKLRFGYIQNSGTPTTSTYSLRSNIGIDTSPVTLNAIRLY